MKKLFTFVALMCLITSVFAQEDTDAKEFQNENVQLLTFNVLAPFALDTPRYRLGYTHGITEHFRAGIEIGYGSDNTTLTIIQGEIEETENYSLFEVLPQVTYIFNPTYRVNHYIALQGFYLNHNERFFNDSYRDTNLGFNIRYDQADYNRKKIGANLLYGVYIPFGSAPVGIDISTGLGIRSRNNTFSNIINPRADQFFEEDDFFDFSNFNEINGTSVALNFALNIKLTYNFNN